MVIVPSTDGMDIFDYTMKVAERWQLGNKDTDNGVLMLVAINDRKIFIATGYGVEGVLPDAIVNRIIREDITPAFKTGQYAQGISAGISRIDERLRADPEMLAQADKAAQDTAKDIKGIDILALFIFAFVFGVILTSALGRFLGASVATAGFGFIGMVGGLGFGTLIIAGVVLWLALILQGAMPKGGGRGGGFGGGLGGGSFGSGHGGSFGGGGFGSGGFGGGGGGFGGGGAGGSW